ncbi:hypothetical protein DPX16_7222 [Anabarilius grahami]|uniref:Uncharacterized protein n=1 Tax=Anabarilius grahami TaxID=495550 RepID=A0A3N0XMT8_ANAGA|nr:hypothetical protein DPX16_7222 [Anabarilius grahami]
MTLTSGNTSLLSSEHEVEPQYQGPAHTPAELRLPPAGSERHFISSRRRTDVLLGRQLSSVGLVCQGNFGHRRCRQVPEAPSYQLVLFLQRGLGTLVVI